MSKVNVFCASAMEAYKLFYLEERTCGPNLSVSVDLLTFINTNKTSFVLMTGGGWGGVWNLFSSIETYLTF